MQSVALPVDQAYRIAWLHFATFPRRLDLTRCARDHKALDARGITELELKWAQRADRELAKPASD